MKKRKLNSKNPKYWDKNQVTGPEIKERKFIKEVKEDNTQTGALHR